MISSKEAKQRTKNKTIKIHITESQSVKIQERFLGFAFEDKVQRLKNLFSQPKPIQKVEIAHYLHFQLHYCSNYNTQLYKFYKIPQTSKSAKSQTAENIEPSQHLSSSSSSSTAYNSQLVLVGLPFFYKDEDSATLPLIIIIQCETRR